MSHSVVSIVLVALGGAAGAVSRRAVELSGLFDRVPWGPTLFCNVSGCLAIGIVWALFSHFNVNEMWCRLCLTGLLGGYTTYSSFSLDAMKLIQAGRAVEALLYVALSLLLGLGACAVGLFAMQKFLKILA